MGLESVTYVSDLVATNPVGAVDPKSQGDDHIRNLKKAILASFPAVTGAVAASHTELNYLDGATGVTGTANTVRSASPTFTGTVGAAAITATGTVTGNLFSGSGASLTALNASNLASGTVPDARFPSTLPALNGSALTSLNASNLASGTVSDGRLSANVPLLNAANTFTSASQAISASSANLNMTATSTNPSRVQFSTNNSVRGYMGADHGATLITGSATGDMIVRAESGGFVFSGNAGSTIHFKLSSSGVVTTPNASAGEVGTKGALSKSWASSSDNPVLADAGKSFDITTTSDFTIPSNASVPYDIGTFLILVSRSGGTGNIKITSDTLYLAGTGFGTTGTRTLTSGGMAVAFKITSTAWLIAGQGLA